MLPGYLGAWPIFVLVWALAVTTGTTRAQTYPATVEFDVAFPRNETYAPGAPLPIRGINASSDYIDSGYKWEIWTNYSTVGNEPYYETFYTNVLNDTEGQFSLHLALNTRNCSRTESSLNFAQHTTYFGVDFELRNSAQRLSNASIITSKDSCPVGLASFSIKGAIKQYTDEFFLDTCPVLADAAPEMNPCAVEVNSTVASRIFANVTATACRRGELTSDCPSPDDKSNTAAQLGLRSVGWSGVVGGLVLGIALLGFYR